MIKPTQAVQTPSADAYEMVLRTWAALAEALRGGVAAQKAWTDQQKHYANRLLGREQR